MHLLECDVHMTEDRVVVVSHDSNLQRLCGIPSCIDKFMYKDLPKMQRSIPLHFSTAHYHLRPEEEGKFATLRELFELATKHIISIDLKDDNDLMKHEVNSLIKEFDRERLTIWGSVKAGQHSELNKINPNIPQFYSFAQVLLVYILYWLGFLFLYPLPADAFMVPLITRHKVKYFRSGTTTFIYSILLVILCAALRNSKNLYKHLRQRGVLVIVWVLNEDEEFLEAMETYGPEIDGMMTDCPSKLKSFIFER